uniref:Uncharacterized protein n=1 Tax=Panagrolaimus davidi TaxID=227884 RepID=A0A914PEQ5_9BILA
MLVAAGLMELIVVSLNAMAKKTDNTGARVDPRKLVSAADFALIIGDSTQLHHLKARGINWVLDSDPSLVSKLQNRDLFKSLMQNTLFFGIDLSHPLRRWSSKYPKGDFGYQAPQKTIVNAALLEAKFDAAINAYYRNSGRYPSWIVYRSGLSEAEVPKSSRRGSLCFESYH